MVRVASRVAARAASRAALVVAVLAVGLAGCSGAATPAPSYPADAIVVTAKDLKFDTDQLVVPAGRPFTLVLVNRDGDPHNIAIRTQAGFDGDLLFRHDPVAASTLVTQAGPLPPGTYYFLCEVHPQMTGTVIAN